jgi:hypothetical protein
MQHLEKLRSEPDRFAKLPLFYAHGQAEHISIGELTFVLESKDPNVLQEIHLAQQSYEACITALTLRNVELEKFYNNPRVVHRVVDFDTGAGITEASQTDLILLKQSTSALYASVDNALPKLMVAFRALYDLSKALYPTLRALKVIPNEHKS